jgi:hypothetical protein
MPTSLPKQCSSILLSTGPITKVIDISLSTGVS